MALPKSLTTVTTFSKLIALFLFVTLPFIGFYLGMVYQQKITAKLPTDVNIKNLTTPSPTKYLNKPASKDYEGYPYVIKGNDDYMAKLSLLNTTDWKVFKKFEGILTFKYPKDYIVVKRDSEIWGNSNSESDTWHIVPIDEYVNAKEWFATGDCCWESSLGISLKVIPTESNGSLENQIGELVYMRSPEEPRIVYKTDFGGIKGYDYYYPSPIGGSLEFAFSGLKEDAKVDLHTALYVEESKKQKHMQIIKTILSTLSLN